MAWMDARTEAFSRPTLREEHGCMHPRVHVLAFAYMRECVRE